jgi:NADH-quinone oxidoreductase subunit A
MTHTEDTILLWPFVVYAAVVVLLVSGILFISYFLGERHQEPETDEVYEGGIIATGTARLLFPVHFYTVALFFVIFDILAAFIIAWAIAVKSVGWPGYIGIVIFISVFATILFYIHSTGALDFATSGKEILKAYKMKMQKGNDI